jgi:hypothetical protein
MGRPSATLKDVTLKYATHNAYSLMVMFRCCEFFWIVLGVARHANSPRFTCYPINRRGEMLECIGS